MYLDAADEALIVQMDEERLTADQRATRITEVFREKLRLKTLASV